MQESTSCPTGNPRLASPRLASPRLASPRLASPRLASLIVGLALASAANCQAQGTAPGTAPTIASPADNSNQKFGTMIVASGGCSTDTYDLTLQWNYADPARGIDQTISSTVDISPSGGKWSTNALNFVKSSMDNGSQTGVYSVRVIAYVPDGMGGLKALTPATSTLKMSP